MIRTPPQSIEAEQAVIGGLMLDPRAITRVADLIDPEDFYRRDHHLIFQAIKELDEKRRPYDAVTLGEWFESQGMSDMVQGGAYLITLASSTPSAANIRAYAEIVADKSKLRRLIDTGTELVNRCFDPDGSESDEIAADAMSGIGSTVAKQAQNLKTVDDSLREMVDDIQRRLDSGDMLGTSFGLPSMDYMTGGKKPGDLIIIAGRPSMGKTAFALQGCMAAGRPLIFSFETMAGNLLARMTANIGRFPVRWITHPGDAPEHSLEMVYAAMKLVKEKLTSAIYDRRRLRWDQLRAIALREHARNPVREVVIDHFGHLLVPGRGRSDQEMGENMKGAKELAREMNVPVVMLMQLNRNVEARVDKRPMLSDLRECGAAEEDADIVAMLYRDEYYNKEPNSPLKGYGEIFLRKNRDGEPGELWVHPVLSEMRFDPAEPQQRFTASNANAGGHGNSQTGIRPRDQPRTLSAVSGGR